MMYKHFDKQGPLQNSRGGPKASLTRRIQPYRSCSDPPYSKVWRARLLNILAIKVKKIKNLRKNNSSVQKIGIHGVVTQLTNKRRSSSILLGPHQCISVSPSQAGRDDPRPHKIKNLIVDYYGNMRLRVT